MPSTSDPTPVTVGTAGHIDHGKTELIHRLTGMRADRPQERERGMTIDIGYAELRTASGRRIGFVDLPGHERFIRNMVAGATGIDLALLVVAADDGVMPQTREHVDILGLLGVRRGVAVLSKVDLVDDETRALAREELKDFLEETSLRGAPVVCCSSVTEEGVADLAALLERLVEEVEGVPHPGAFFMAVQRRFAAAGFGCIATGVPSAGTVATGDELELLPARRRARVRAIEVYHQPREHARAGHRTALNLAGLHHDDVGRGMVVAHPGVYAPSRHLAARLTLLASARRALKHAAPVRLLSGTFEEMATVYLTEGDALRPGDEGLVELRCSAAVVTPDGAPFILRSSNARETIGGGRLIGTLEGPLGRRDRARHEALLRWAQTLDDPDARVRAALEEADCAGPHALAVRCQLTASATEEIVRRLEEAGDVVPLAGGGVARAPAVQAAAEALREALETLHREEPLVAALPLARVRDRAGVSEALLAAGLERLGAEVVLEGRTLRLASHRVEVDQETSRAADTVLACLLEARFAPPARDRVAQETGLDPKNAEAAFALLADRGEVREVAPGVSFAKETLDEGVRLLRAVARKRGQFEPVEAKAAFGGISRKWLIPLLEFYDRLGATRRDGNARILTRRGEAMAEGGIDVT